MTPKLAISLLYGLMTLSTICILYFSFRGTKDYSSRFFLVAESQSLVTAAYVALVSLDPSYRTPILSFVGNFTYFVSEVSIIFSVYALTSPIRIKRYFLALLAGAGYGVLMEWLRAFYPSLPALLYPLSLVFLSAYTLVVCFSIDDRSLKSNPFMKWFTILMAGLLCIAIARIASLAWGFYLAPMGSDAMAVTIYACYVAINLLRYIAYQSLRMTWVPNADQASFLNSHLADFIHKNNQLVSGIMRSNRMLGVSALAGSLAHQLSQPLTGAALETESIKRDLARPGHKHDAAASLSKVSLQLGKLAELVRNLRKLFDGKDQQQFQVFGLAAVCDEILALTEPTATAKKITVTKTYRANPTVCGDAIQIQQVLINLLNNAIEAFADQPDREPRQITLCVDQGDGMAILTVADNGSGIASDLLPSIFDLYKTTKQEGMGMGLWLSETIVSRHRGQISAANNVDGGAIFTVKLPLAEA